MSRQSLILAAAGVAVVFPAAAGAHPASVAHEHGLEAGLLHPLTGLDHLLVMVAIGVWAARSGVREIWIAPACFVTGMMTGLLAGFPLVSAAGIELGVALSIVALGLLLASTVNLARWMTILIAACAGMFHGAAHAAEGPIQSGLTSFAVGALLTTLVLHIVGALTGLATSRANPSVLRFAGMAMAIVGLGVALTPA
jgi:urease accessory protein